ncbi:MAG: DUF4434 domain-containing protein [Bacteroidetes bacterium]|nr:DUF4434 domain-containing protein [Bacteroidota bacterium]
MKNAKITGSFVDFSELTHKDQILLPWTVEDWVEEFSDMLEAGITTAIIARTMRYGAVYYHSDYFETHNEHDSLSPFMEAARETGMRVFVSGMISDHFFNADNEKFNRLMKRDLYIYSTVLSELIGKYGSLGIIDGIYISHEADNENMAHPDRQLAAQNFFGNLYAKLKDLIDLPILSSPFFTRKSTPGQLAKFWETFLDRPMFDILAMQDGVGCNRDISPEIIPAYYKALQPVFDSRNIVFWNNIESFSFNPGYKTSGYDRSKIWFKTAPIDRIDRQFSAGTLCVDKTIMWEYGHFFSRKQAGEDLYDSFRRWNLGQ